MAPGMVGHPTRWVWLVALGWEREAPVKMGDLTGRRVARRPAGVNRSAAEIPSEATQTIDGKAAKVAQASRC